MHSQPEQVRTRVKTRVGTRAQCNVSERCIHTNDHWRALRGLMVFVTFSFMSVCITTNTPAKGRSSPT